MIRRFILPAAAGVVLLVPSTSPASAQEDPVPTVIPQDSVTLVLTRFQTLQQQVQALQQEVMNASPTLQEQQAAVTDMVESAVAEIDPTLQSEMEARLPSIQQEAQTAQAAGDTTRLQALEAEFVALRSRAEDAQQAAVDRPEIAAEIESFEESLRSEMEARNPGIAGALAELEALAGRLDATLGGG